MRIRQTFFGAVNAAVVAGLLFAAPSLHASTHARKHKKASSSSAKPGSAKKASTKLTAGKSGSKTLKRTRHTRNWKRHGQQTVDGRRTEQIQQALIQSHYLDGEPSGAWDARTQEALRRYQAANGWQSKVVPDSRALIKLGLGPSNDKLLNPDSAMTSRFEAAPAVSNTNSPRQ